MGFSNVWKSSILDLLIIELLLMQLHMLETLKHKAMNLRIRGLFLCFLEEI